jgi:ABC-2 type transport system permease protein
MILSKLQLHLSKVFLMIFLRDRQSIFFSLFFPIIFMSVFGFVNNGQQEPLDIGVVNESDSVVAADFVQQLKDSLIFNVTVGTENRLRSELEEGDQSMVLVIPEIFNAANLDRQSVELRILVDAAQLSLVMPLLEQTLIEIEREFRDTEPMFSLAIEDVQARSQSYLDFLLPGLMAFTLMQLSIAGSGYNIIEFRRKGILKRLFVTPIRPNDFITAIVLARTTIVLTQLSVLIMFAILVLDVQIIGNFAAFYFVVILGTFIFLNLGFCLGSIAKTQQAGIMIGNIVIFPQIFLSGVFFPIESMPELVQPIAYVLPLSFVSTGMRDIANGGVSLLAILPSLIGIAVWLVVSYVLATRLFVWKEVAN